MLWFERVQWSEKVEMKKKKRRKEETLGDGGDKDRQWWQHNSPLLPFSRSILGLFWFCILFYVEGRINSVNFLRRLRRRRRRYLSPTYDNVENSDHVKFNFRFFATSCSSTSRKVLFRDVALCASRKVKALNLILNFPLCNISCVRERWTTATHLLPTCCFWHHNCCDFL